MLEGVTGYILSLNEFGDDRFSPSLGVTVEPVDGLQLFTRYTEGLRALSLVELGQTYNAPVRVNPDLEPEVVKTWEFGLNYIQDNLVFKDDALRARLVYFNNDYGDTFTTRTGDAGSSLQRFFYQNIPGVEVSGLELSLFYDVERVFADLNVTTFDTIFDPDTVIGIQSSIQQPEYTTTLTVGTRWFDGALELGGRLNAFGELPLEDGLFRASDIFAETAYYWSAQEIVDLYGAYDLNDNLSIGFSAENVADTYYVPPLYVSRIPSPGRTVRVNFTATF